MPSRVLSIDHNTLVVVGHKERPIDGYLYWSNIKLAIDDFLLEYKA